MQELERIYGPEKDKIYFSVHDGMYWFDGNTGELQYALSRERQREIEEAIAVGESSLEVLESPKALEGKAGSLWEEEVPVPRPQVYNLFISGTCNLSCKYCVNSRGTLGTHDCLMSMETALKFLRFFEDNLQETPHQTVSINLFGGEPLLNLSVSKVILEGIQRIRQKKSTPRIRVILLTNGTIEDEELLKQFQEMSNDCVFCVSLDGCENRHDTNRTYKNGTGSWQKAYEYTLELRERGLPFSVTAVVPYPYDYIQTAQELIDLGYKVFEVKDIIPYSYGGDSEAKIFRTDFDLWRRNYLAYTDFCLNTIEKNQGIYPVDHLNLIQDYQRAFMKQAPYACALAHEKVGISVTGEIYPCESLVHSEFLLGSVDVGWDVEKCANFYGLLEREGQLKYNRRECVQCFAKHACGGGCYALNRDQKGRISEVLEARCRFIREKLKIDLYFLSELSRRDLEFVKKEGLG